MERGKDNLIQAHRALGNMVPKDGADSWLIKMYLTVALLTDPTYLGTLKNS